MGDTLDEMAARRCSETSKYTPVVKRERAEELIKSLEGWSFSEDGKSILRDYVMANFEAAVEFIGRLAQVAESQDHHPDIHLTDYRNLRIEYSTHVISGLTDNDFVMAAKTERLKKKLKGG